MPEQADETQVLLQALTPREQARLTGILARLSSPYDGERAAAGLLASAFVARHGLGWLDVVALLQPLPERSTAPDVPTGMLERRGAGGRSWRGYCRRRLATIGRALNWLS